MASERDDDAEQSDRSPRENAPERPCQRHPREEGRQEARVEGEEKGLILLLEVHRGRPRRDAGRRQDELGEPGGGKRPGVREAGRERIPADGLLQKLDAGEERGRSEHRAEEESDRDAKDGRSPDPRDPAR